MRTATLKKTTSRAAARAPLAAATRRVYTVSELTGAIRSLLEGQFPYVWVAGEISNCKTPASGHMYFVLKDASAQIQCAFFKHVQRQLKFSPEDGLQVLCGGRLSVYNERGQYQLYVEQMEPQGLGALQLAFEQLKEKLDKAGLFDPARKRPLPVLPQGIGIVTSATGAVIHDILRTLGNEFPWVVLNPVRVQGEGASLDIAAAIDELNRFNGQRNGGAKLDILIVGRGGGSLEDLWAFNEEPVAQAIYRSAIPVISAVGHEIDWTIADFVADIRAATPLDAARMLVHQKHEVATGLQLRRIALNDVMQQRLQTVSQRLDEVLSSYHQNMAHQLAMRRERLFGMARHLSALNPQQQIAQWVQRIGTLSEHLHLVMRHRWVAAQHSVQTLAGALHSLSPLAVLARGYSITQTAGEHIVTEASQVARGDHLTTRLHRGRIISKVEEVE